MTALLCGVFGSSLGLVPALGIAAFPFAVVGLACGVIAMVRASKGVRTGKAMAIAGTLLCVLALILATFGIVVIANSFKDRGDSRKAITGRSTEDILRNDLDVQFGQFVTDDNPYQPGKMVVTLRNKGNKNASFSVDVEALNANGNRIAHDTAFVEALAPGHAIRKDMFVFVTSDLYDTMKTVTFKVVEASKYAPMPPPTT
ncbi:hypothetical protein LAUMK35_04269 [Mycobacterium pseudokansasii]|uniref:DUF4190 domain-containing protein n=1 Tax=Mycobacterium pseudokansasii TaxID=2341080 RepID=A0A498QSN6_9MYCO|nr:hypothetical protein LAUMK35_04269 [Mycobacterium pseudokansasii]VBA30443.1 hypothetical protein LAUMK21_04263 [Mycobacterium pseudokansasii]VBA53597.1 hypothetical protein LAUMK142_04160 [Mycobacterium pseudokansasii]